MNDLITAWLRQSACLACERLGVQSPVPPYHPLLQAKPRGSNFLTSSQLILLVIQKMSKIHSKVKNSQALEEVRCVNKYTVEPRKSDLNALGAPQGNDACQGAVRVHCWCFYSISPSCIPLCKMSKSYDFQPWLSRVH